VEEKEISHAQLDSVDQEEVHELPEISDANESFNDEILSPDVEEIDQPSSEPIEKETFDQEELDDDEFVHISPDEAPIEFAEEYPKVCSLSTTFINRL
jgi:hypothetical protein